MSNLSQLFPGGAAGPAPASAALRRVHVIAQVMVRVLPVVALLLLAGTLAVWLNPAWILAALPGQMGLAARDLSIDAATQAVGLAVTAVPLGISLYALWQAQLLFRRYLAGEVFSTGAALILRRIALCVVALAAVRPVVRSLLSVVLTFHNPPGKRMLAIGLSSDDLAVLLVGGLLLAIAWVMVEASRMAEDNAHFV